MVESPLNIELFQSKKEMQSYSRLRAFIVNEQTLFRYAREISEPTVVPDLLGKSVQVSERQFPRIYQRVASICRHIDLPIPDLYVYEGYFYLIDSNGLDEPRLEISARLIRDFSDAELTHALTKELIHIKLDHISTEVLVERMQAAFRTMGGLPVVNTLNLVGGPQMLTMALRATAFKWFREAVFSAENFATAYVGDLKASVTSTLLQVFHNRQVVAEMDISAFCDQISQIEVFDNAAATYAKMDEVNPYAPHRIGNMISYATSERGCLLRQILADRKSE